MTMNFVVWILIQNVSTVARPRYGVISQIENAIDMKHESFC